MSKDEMRDWLILGAARIESAIRLDEKTDHLFVFGTDTFRQLHIKENKWDLVVNTLQRTVVYNPNFGIGSIEAYFYEELFGEQYKIFTLIDRSDKNG